ncbi:MAG TPA: monooxygenase [Mycobacteriales bacterium]|jgi:hypothetical protein|nr:monooxygenase [Mycobacteriales bacterium]
MREPVPELVTLHLWRVPRRAVPAAVLRMGADRRPVRVIPGVRFAKLFGTGDGRTFTVRDADPRQWGLLTTWSDRAAARAFERSAVATRWRRLAEESWRVELRPLASRGRWSGRQPFGTPAGGRWDGPVVAVTRARLAPTRARSFWRAVPAVSADLLGRPGLRFAFGIGEAPIGFQGTFSLWESAAALRGFAYAGDAHREAVARTGPEGWFAEELFARFAVEAADGSVDGRDPLA